MVLQYGLDFGCEGFRIEIVVGVEPRFVLVRLSSVLILKF